MALPPFQRASFEPSEQVFLTIQTESIFFIPSFNMPKFRSLSGTSIGPFLPLRPIQIPLWVALQSKKKRRGKIICPEWMSSDSLRSTYEREVGEQAFSELPFRWLEISKLLIDVASDDIPSLEEVRSLLKAIREVRQSKLRKGLSSLDGLHLETLNLASLEIGEIRPSYSLAHIKLLQLNPQADVFDEFVRRSESVDPEAVMESDDLTIRQSDFDSSMSDSFL